MKPTKHQPCGTEHWSNEPCPALKKGERRPLVTKEMLQGEGDPAWAGADPHYDKIGGGVIFDFSSSMNPAKAQNRPQGISSAQGD